MVPQAEVHNFPMPVHSGVQPEPTLPALPHQPPEPMPSPPSGPDDSDEDMPGQPASNPEDALREVEDALSRIETLADLEEEPGEPADGSSPPKTETDAASDAGPPPDAKSPNSSDDPDATYAADPTPGDGPPEDQCENCGALLNGPYCSQCGQKAADRIVPVWHMINEALEAVFELDLRVLHTMPKFLFLPGRLTKEYLNGRRKRYIRPFRLYLFATFLLFTTLALTTGGGLGLPFPPAAVTAPADTVRTASAPVSVDPLAAGADTTIASSSVPDTLVSTGQGPSVFGSQRERNRMAREIESDSSFVHVNVLDDPRDNARLERLVRQKVAQTVRNPWEFVNRMIDRGPYVMFLMLPLFAFLLKLLYVRRGRLYIEHLIFSLHVHAHAFFAFTVGLLLGESSVDGLNTLGVFVQLSPLLYLVLAMKHVYNQGLIKSSIKAFLLLVVYSILLSFGLAVLVLVALLLM